jgi:hypothetical protein
MGLADDGRKTVQAWRWLAALAVAATTSGCVAVGLAPAPGSVPPAAERPLPPPNLGAPLPSRDGRPLTADEQKALEADIERAAAAARRHATGR